MHNIPRSEASYITMMLFFGTVIGSPFLGWFSDRIALRRLPMLVCALVSVVLICILMFSSQMSFWSLIVLFFALGFFTSAQIISYPLIAESNPHSITGTATGIASVLIMSGGITQPIFGWLLGLHWQHTYHNGVPLYSHMDYEIAMSIMPIAFVIACVTAIIIRETYCKART
jgi:MFS family permease